MIESLAKATNFKFDLEAEIEFIKLQAEAASRNTTFKWVV